MHYFGYCTSLSEEELRKDVPDATRVTKATAVNHKVEFRAAADKGDRGWCHLSSSWDALGHAAEGVVFRVDDSHLNDKFESYDIFYLTVRGEDGVAYDCFTYVLSQPGVPMRPPDFSWNTFAKGLEEQGFSADYRAGIAATYREAPECPDAGRAARPAAS